MKLHENLLALRKKKGLTQTDVASKIGIDPRTYQNYEYGGRIPTLMAAVALADLYNVSLDTLIGREWGKT